MSLIPLHPVLARVGLGLRALHLDDVIGGRPAVAWFEVHAENYMHAGPALGRLDAIRRDYPISLHGVGLSLGNAGPLDRTHLGRLAALADRIDPALVSEHLCWSTASGAYLNDLLPLPYTVEAFDHVCCRVAAIQDTLHRPILVENPSSYLAYAHSPIPEPEFLAALARRTGCGLLLDVNNVHVSAHNLGFDARAYLDALPATAVGEIHLAGHAVNHANGQTVLIDDHGGPVDEAVWDLYAHALLRFRRVPTLIEWDTGLPPFATLMREARLAERVIDLTLNGADRADAA